MTERRYSSQAMTIAVATPSAKPTTGGEVEPAAWTALQKNSAVSRPSRATAMNAVAATAIAPSSSAAASEPDRSARMLCARCGASRRSSTSRSPTATIDSVPPKISRDCPVCRMSARRVGQQRAERDADRDGATPTPSPTGASRSRRSVLHEVGDQDADDEGGLQALTQSDEVVREHG